MPKAKGNETSGKEATPNSFQINAPAITMPKGGGAIRGIGEKFAANPVTGTGSMTIPIATSPGRSGFGPQLSLSYDSGTGNGPFGLGWNLSIPAITRKTDKGLPKYQDAAEADVFILSGTEDLVPILIKDTQNLWIREVVPDRTVYDQVYRIQRYRPRLEGLFARIECWTNKRTPGDTFWRAISKDNVTTWYGKSDNSRVADPSDKSRVFSWLICESYDDKGNVIAYTYKEENAHNIDVSQVHERNRTADTRKVNRYLKRIRYGNPAPYLSKLLADEPWPTLPADDQWFFEAVFDYGEHYTEGAQDQSTSVQFEDTNRQWSVRPDPFSSYRSGFEVRTYRRCQRVLMFHRFSELGSTPCLVRSTDFTYLEEHSLQPVKSLIASFITGAMQSGYIRNSDGTYFKKSLPPLDFEYSEAIIDETVRDVDSASLENLPQGLDGSAYQWVDLDGEGLSGILTEQAGAWFYKRNQSALPVADQVGRFVTVARFSPLETLATMPSPARLSAGQQLMDLAGDGQIDVVEFDGPIPGFFERTPDDEWDTLTAFASLPNIAWKDPHLKFIDLTGDGHADILITEDDAFTWYPSLAEAGFGPGEKVRQGIDEEQGPRLVFTDGTQSVYLADMSGDGLTDLVRIRNSDVCYWPNIGYGRFGAKVTMGNAPLFDYPDQFDQKRIRLADIDGSGVVDILYLSGTGVHLYFNQSGNTWGTRRTLSTFPRIDNFSSVTTVDLLGNGTACLVWSSPLPGDTGSPMRYIDLMGGNKPHLLVKTWNNLGAETEVSYVSSTKFYLADKLAGKRWISRLPFPVHCVEKVTVRDKWRQTEFSTTYSYHHGYFDGVEREFRGFGRVEQVDTESYGKFLQGNITSPYITDDQTLYQPPMKSVTWYHTGVALNRQRILNQFADEYFPQRFADRLPDPELSPAAFHEKPLPEPELSDDLNADEWREALRACKGSALRQEVYELDVDDLAARVPKHTPVRILSAATHNCHIELLQARSDSLHSVFLVTESEAITYNYELDLRESDVNPDPRIAHTLNLRIDEFGHVLQSVAVEYPRVEHDTDTILLPAERDLIDRVQQEQHLAYTENRFTSDTDIINDADNYRLPVLYEVLTYELTGISPPDTDDSLTVDPWDDFYFTLDELQRYRLSDRHQTAGVPVTVIPYQQRPSQTNPVPSEKRLVEHVRMLFFRESVSDVDPLPLRQQGRLGLPYETYKLALTGGLLTGVFGAKLTPDALATLDNSKVSGYLSGTQLVTRFSPEPTTGEYWIRSGTARFENDAAQHFYLPERYTDPFGNITTLKYDPRDLFLESSTDMLGNTTRVVGFDYRVLAPSNLKDINDNETEAYFDILGMVVAVAAKGKGIEGDNLTGFDYPLANPTNAELEAFFTVIPFDQSAAIRWLGNASTRHLYYFGETADTNGKLFWGQHPASACGIVPEQHVAQLARDNQSAIQVALEYSDGMGSVLVKKGRAEPETNGAPLRWIASGKTILNNKGKPVKQYEPYFSATEHLFDETETTRQVDFTPIMYYDSAGRLIRTELPDGTLSRVEFSPWHVRTFDQNDTVKESRWYRERQTTAERNELLFQPGASVQEQAEAHAVEAMAAAANAQDKRTATLAAKHANTPTLTILDSLGRNVITIADLGVPDADGKSKYLTFSKLDAEGKPLWIRDARGNLVMQYINPPVPNNQASDPATGFVPCYDIAGNLLFQHSMDAGDRWMLMDAAGKPMLAWDFNKWQDQNGVDQDVENRLYFTDYDALHRPIAAWLRINDGNKQMIERFEYLDTTNSDGTLNVQLAANQTANLIGQLVRHYDPSGRVETVRRDFKGNATEVRRRLNNIPAAALIDWQDTDADATRVGKLEEETFVQITEFDALNRMIRQYNWHLPAEQRVAIYEPTYNQRGALMREDLITRATGYDPSTGTRTAAIQDIRYNAKGQKEYLKLGNGTVTSYTYDPQTLRLTNLDTLRGTAPLQTLSYTYDPVGNIMEIYDDAQTPVFFNQQQVDPRSRYEYDALYRLVKAGGREDNQLDQGPTHKDVSPLDITFPITNVPITDLTLRNYEQTYQYDQVGNFTRMRHNAGAAERWTRHFEVATNSNRLLHTWDGTNRGDAGMTDYAYDTHGNMLNLNNTPQQFRNRWDFRDMISSLDLGGGGLAYYQYDAGKQRTRKRIDKPLNNIIEERMYIGGFERSRRWVAGTLVEEIETHHLFEGEQRVLLVDDVIRTDNSSLPTGPLFRYQYSNHLGSACLELNHQAKIISYEEYHPYGTTAYRMNNKAVKATAKRHRYTGMEKDEESGLSYHGARYYASWLGRWVSADPKGMVDGTNLYAYVRNNPLIYADPTGSQCDPTMQSCIDPAAPTQREEAKQQSLLEEHPAAASSAPPSQPETSFNLQFTPSVRVGIDPTRNASVDQASTEVTPSSPGPNGWTIGSDVTTGTWFAIRGMFTPTGANGASLSGPLILWTGGPAYRAAQSMPGYTIADTAYYQTAIAEEMALRQVSGGGIFTGNLPQTEYNAIWGKASVLAVRDATLSGQGVTTANNLATLPSNSIQAGLELPRLRALGFGMGGLSIVGGGLMLASREETDPEAIRTLKVASGVTSIGGGVVTIGGAVLVDAELMCIGTGLSTTGGLLAAPVMSYQLMKQEAQRQQMIAPLVREQLDAGNYLGAALLSRNPMMIRYGF
ncbi:MAG: SpvB/TcaC N-terminal domain-containing protein [Gemmatimonadaceae bacterium]